MAHVRLGCKKATGSLTSPSHNDFPPSFRSAPTQSWVSLACRVFNPWSGRKMFLRLDAYDTGH